jgi:hypothetical protein
MPSPQSNEPVLGSPTTNTTTINTPAATVPGPDTGLKVLPKLNPPQPDLGTTVLPDSLPQPSMPVIATEPRNQVFTADESLNASTDTYSSF